MRFFATQTQEDGAAGSMRRQTATARFQKRSGFTLIELLIVIAIIAILALIAVPNFLESQVRAKVARSEADMRSLAAGLEAYFVDFNAYPIVPPWPDGGWDNPIAWLVPLTTPVGHITLLPKYVWKPVAMNIGGKRVMVDYYDYKDRWSWDKGCAAWGGQPWWVWDRTDNHRWALYAVGPDAQINYHPGVWLWPSPPEALAPGANQLPYDPTNGTMSLGDLIRLGP